MYEVLIAHLRECEKLDPSNNTYKEAADAIEELQGRAKVLEKVADKWCEAVPKWIPVTERLPEENAPCIVYNKYYGPMVGWRVDGERFRIPGSRFPDHPTHWMPLPQMPKEGE